MIDPDFGSQVQKNMLCESPRGNQVDGLPRASSFGPQNIECSKSDRSFELRYFFILENVILIWIAGPKPQIYEINISKSWGIDCHFDRKICTKK